MKKILFVFLFTNLLHTNVYAKDNCDPSSESLHYCEGKLKLNISNNSNFKIHVFSVGETYATGKQCDKELPPQDESTCEIPIWAGVGDEHGTINIHYKNGSKTTEIQYKYVLTPVRCKSPFVT